MSIIKLCYSSVRSSWGALKQHPKLLWSYVVLFGASALPAVLSPNLSTDAANGYDGPISVAIIIAMILKGLMMLALGAAVVRSTFGEDTSALPLMRQIFFRGFLRCIGLVGFTTVLIMVSVLALIVAALFFLSLTANIDIAQLLADPQKLLDVTGPVLQENTALFIGWMATVLGLYFYMGSRLCWSYPLLLTQDKGVFASIAESWRLSSGRSLKLIGALMIFIVLSILIIFPLAAVSGVFSAMMVSGTMVMLSQFVMIFLMLLMNLISDLILYTGGLSLLFAKSLKMRMDDQF